MASADAAADGDSPPAAVEGAATDGAATDGAVDAPLVHADTTIAATANGMASRRALRCVVKSDLL
jgi:hypothetical protein